MLSTVKGGVSSEVGLIKGDLDIQDSYVLHWGRLMKCKWGVGLIVT